MDIGRSDEYRKAIKFADKLIAKARKQRDKHGYRENLGYDLGGELADYMNQFDMSYREKRDVLDYYDRLCDQL